MDLDWKWIISAVLELLILVAVLWEGVIGYKAYNLMKRKKGRPKKSKTERYLEKISKKLHIRTDIK